MEHGSHVLIKYNSLIYLKSIGPTNLERAIRLCREYRELASTIYSESWAEINDLSQWEFGTPEIFQLFREVTSWAFARNLLYSVNIIGKNHILKESLLKDIHNIDVGMSHQNYSFLTADEAFNFLKSKGIEVSNEIRKLAE